MSSYVYIKCHSMPQVAGSRTLAAALPAPCSFLLACFGNAGGTSDVVNKIIDTNPYNPYNILFDLKFYPFTLICIPFARQNSDCTIRQNRATTTLTALKNITVL